MTWAGKRQLFTITAIIGVVVLFFILSNVFGGDEEGCFDGIQNLGEEGIDCGGSCLAVCQDDALDVAILWSRVVPVIDDVYTAVALVENPNTSYTAYDVPYTFKLYDSENILVYERKGSGTIPSGETFPFFETAIRTQERTPVRATFEFRELPFWERDTDVVDFEITSKIYTEDEGAPRLTALVRNPSITRVEDVSFVALLFDISGNLVNASRSVVSVFEPEKTETIIFTWPQAFGVDISRVEVIESSFKR